jgi:hypothetical protein
MKRMYQVTNPTTLEVTAGVYDDNDPIETKMMWEAVNKKATGTKYGVVFDPQGRWKFEDKELILTPPTV